MRRAVVRTGHDDPATVAAALRPDNTAEMTTEVRDDRVVTAIERETTAGLRSTVDDYVVNLRVAERAAAGGAASGKGATGPGRDDRSGSDLGEQRDDRPNDDTNHE